MTLNFLACAGNDRRDRSQQQQLPLRTVVIAGEHAGQQPRRFA
jgi:hypothetical protein